MCFVIVKFGVKSIVKCVSAEPVGGEKERRRVAINNALSGARIEHGSWMVSSVVKKSQKSQQDVSLQSCAGKSQETLGRSVKN